MEKNMKKTDNKFPYLPTFMSKEISVGTAIGAALNNIGLYMCIGLSIGVGIGAILDSQKGKEEE